MIRKHHTPNYIISKLRLKIFEFKNPNAPWLTRDAINLLNQLIKRSDIGLEFGSGRSTKWFAHRCKKLISIENNKTWYSIVKADLSNYDNVQYIFATVNINNHEQSEYLTVLSYLQNNSVDFIVNDGKLRDWVAFQTVDKLKTGGLYVLDNAERYIPNDFDLPESIGPNNPVNNERWRFFIEYTSVWRKIWTVNGVSTTLILFKP